MERSSATQLPQDQEHSAGELVKMMSEQVSVLIRDELKLAQLEMTSKGRQAALGAGMFGASKADDVKARAQGKADDVKSKAAAMLGQLQRSEVVQRRWPLAAAAAGVLVVGAILIWKRRKT